MISKYIGKKVQQMNTHIMAKKMLEIPTLPTLKSNAILVKNKLLNNKEVLPLLKTTPLHY
jgi:hypothetical protein